MLEKGTKDSPPIELWVADPEKRIPIDLSSRGLVFKLPGDQLICIFTEDLKEFLLHEKEKQVEHSKEYKYRLKGDPENSLLKIFR